MSNFKLSYGFAELTNTKVYSFTNQNANYSSDNLIDFSFPLRPIRTTVASTSVLRCELTQPGTIYGIYIRHTNITTIEARFSSSSGTFSTPHASLTPYKDRRTGRYNCYSDVLNISSANAHYLQLTMSGAALDGDSSYYIGNVYVVSSITELNHDMPPDYNYRINWPKFTSSRDDGSSSVIDFKKPKVSFSLPIKAATDANASLGWSVGGEQQLFDILNENHEKGVIFYENRTRDLNENLGRFYHVRQPEDITVTYPGTDEAFETNIDVEEIT